MLRGPYTKEHEPILSVLSTLPENLQDVILRDHSEQCRVQYLENNGLAMGQSDWLNLVIGPLK